MKRFQIGVLAILITLVPLASASAQANEYDFTGPYARGSFALGWANTDVSGVNVTTMVGFGMAGGYRATPWLGVDGEFVYTGAGDIEENGTDVADARVLGFTLNARGYPLAEFGKDLLPKNIQPYGVLGMGGGSAKATSGSSNLSEGSFLFRFGGGLDYLFNDDWGAFFDISYFVTTEDTVVGTGIMQFGVLYRF